jgi:DNA polymerase III epsilon subunit-like protein
MKNEEIANFLKNLTTNVVIFDTETTGINWYKTGRFVSGLLPEEEQEEIRSCSDEVDRICEIAALTFEEDGSSTFIEELCKPPVPVHPIAADTHGYQNFMLKDKPPFHKLKQAYLFPQWNEEGKYLIAHNVEFDLRMLSYEGIDWDRTKVIDTLAVVRHLYGLDDIEKHTLQYIRMLLRFDEKPWFKSAMTKLGLKEIKPHTALSDIFVLWLLYAFLAVEHNLSKEDMVRMTNVPAEESGIGFGAFFEKGTPYLEVANSTYQGGKRKGCDYLQWALENMGMAANREYAIKKALALYHFDLAKKGMRSYRQEHVSFAMLYILEDKEDIKKAIEFLGKPEGYAFMLAEKAINVHNEKLKTLPDPKLQEQEFQEDFAKRRALIGLLKTRLELLKSI